MSQWSRWFTGDRDPDVPSLFKPAQKLGLTPGELLDIILERRRRHLISKLHQDKAQPLQEKTRSFSTSK